MGQKFKVHELLTRADLDSLEEFAREPGRTVDETHEWLTAQGFILSRGAVWNWKREFDSRDRFRASNEMARALLDAAKSGGAVSIGDAVVLQVSQMLFEQMWKAQESGIVETKELLQAAMAIRHLIAGKQAVEQLIAERFDKEMAAKAKGRADGRITEQDIAEARRAIFGK